MLLLQILLFGVGLALGVLSSSIGDPRVFPMALVVFVFAGSLVTTSIQGASPESLRRKRLFLLSFPLHRAEVILGEWLSLVLTGLAYLIVGFVGLMAAVPPGTTPGRQITVYLSLACAFLWVSFALFPLYLLCRDTRLGRLPAVPLILTFLFIPLAETLALITPGWSETSLIYLPGAMTLQSAFSSSSPGPAVLLYELRASLFWGLLFILLAIARFRTRDLLPDA
jgi:ABC-type transport system involved in multi-copper enzyme maturation permease subunit